MSESNSRDRLLNRITPTRAGFGVGIIVTALCLLAAYRTFGFIDSGELAASASILGVPHPTGYPLLMILGRIAVLIVPGPEIMALNILASILVGTGAGVLVVVFSRLLAMLQGESEGEGTAGGNVIYAAGAALLTALTSIWWSQGTVFEAYALHAVMLPLVLLAFLRYMEAEEHVPAREAGRFRVTRAALLFGLVTGLAFSNHMMTILLAPALLFWFFMRFGFRPSALVRIGAIVPGFLLGLLPYLYLPIRAAAHPPINWGMPTTFGRFIAHVTGEQFQHLMRDVSVFGKQLGWYFGTLPGELAWGGLIVAMIGLYLLLRKSGRLAAFSALLFLACLLYAGTYAIKDIEPYFLTATVAVGIWIAVGLRWIGVRFGTVAAASLALVLAAISGVVHWSGVNQSDNYMAEDLGRNLLRSLPKGSVLLTTRWDLLNSGVTYLQTVEGMRQDVVLINLNMLHDRVYLSQILERYPELKRGEDVNKRIRTFVTERRRYEMMPETRNERAAGYNNTFYGMVNGMIGASGRPVFVTSEVEGRVGLGWYRHPYRLALRVMPDSTYLPQEPLSYTFRMPSRDIDADMMATCTFYANAFLARGMYEQAHGQEERAAGYLRNAAKFRPDVKRDDVPLLPMGNRRYVFEGIDFFERLSVRTAQAVSPGDE